jgi:hypothetical protein
MKLRMIHVLVEGQTEEAFVRDVLFGHFYERGIVLQPTLVVTKRVKSGGHFKGGVVSYHQVRGDVRRLLGDTSAVVVTTMLDYYGLPNDFPGKNDHLSKKGCYERVAYVERAFAKEIDHPRFRPHLMLHEFEALLFTDPASFESLFGAGCAQKLGQIRDQFGSPEEIDEGPETAPSKRLRDVFPRYQKPQHGPQAAQIIGLAKMRAACAHFDAWLTLLEGI